MLKLLYFKNVIVNVIYFTRNMLEIVCKVLFFLSMLVVYANVTSTSSVIAIVFGYVACVFSYYYFNNIHGAIDEWLNYFYINARLNDAMNPSQISGYFVNRKYNKINNNGGIPSVGSKKMFSALCNSENTFPKESNLLDSCGPSIMKTDYKSNGDLPSPIMKNGSPLRNNRLSREKLKINFDSKAEVTNRKNVQQMYNPLGSTRRYNANLDLETYMNVNSPGFTSRVVDKAAESASYHMKYPAVRQISTYRFDKSTIRQLSKMPKAGLGPTVRIASPETATIDLLSNEHLSNETINDDVRSNNFLQVLKDISRKRNYSQEETDRTGSTPKKSRKTDVKNVMSSQYKRAHEDCSNDSIEDKSRKKRCDDTDRNYAKMMSFTSSMSVLAPEFSWSNHSKKRKSSRLEKSKNESSEKLEKFRKISEDSVEEVEKNAAPVVRPKVQNNATYTVKSKESDIPVEKESQRSSQPADITDSKFVEMFPTDEDGEYVRVASGKILNRTNCTYRKKLNNTKIDPVSVITTEPEYVSGTSYVDDKTMKENLLNNLMNDIERKGEKNDSVIFYQNSIVEEIEKNVTHVEVHQPDTEIHTSSSFNPLLPITTKPVNNLQFNAPAVSLSTEEFKVNSSSSDTNSSLFTNVFKPTTETNDSLVFGTIVDVSNSTKSVSLPTSAKIPEPAVSEASFNATSTCLTPIVTSTPTPTITNIPLQTTPVSSNLGAGNTQQSVFNSSTQANTTQSSIVEGNKINLTQPSLFESNTSTNNSQSLIFGAASQTTSQGLTFGSNTQSTTQPLMFGTSTQSVQPTGFDSTSHTNTGTSVPKPQPLFGAKETSGNVFGQPQAPTSQTTQFGGSSNEPGFTFGANQPSVFGGTPATTSFNTNTPSCSFSENNSTFGGASVPQSSSSQVFNFGSSGTATSQPSQPTQPTFQFGANSSTMPSSQTLMFGGGSTGGNVCQPTTSINTSASSNPLLSSTTKPTINNFQFNAPPVSSSITSVSNTSISNTNTSSLFTNGFKSNTESNAPFTFGASSMNTANSPKIVPAPAAVKIQECVVPQTMFNATQTNMAPVLSSPSVFGSLSQTSTTQPSIFGSTQTNATQPSVFVSNMQTNASQSSMFGGSSQTTSQVFGTNAQSTTQPLMFGTSTQPAAQSCVFDSTTQVSASATNQSSLFGAGDTTSNIFGQPQASAPPVGVVNPLPQTAQFGGNSNERGFAFGASEPTAFGNTPAATPAANPFGAGNTVRHAFNVNAPSFGFSGTTGFGVGNNNAFGGANVPQPANNQVIFNFGSNNTPTAQPSQLAQPRFQFGASTSTVSNSQPFMFGGGAAPAASAPSTAGGFSIGTGGSNNRSRALARPRKTK